VQQHPDGPNFEQALAILRRRSVLILFCVVVAGGAAFAFSSRQTKKYTASASLSFSTNPLSQQVAGLPGVSNSSSSLQAQQISNVQRVRSRNVAAEAARLLDPRLTTRSVINSVSVAGQGESSLVAVSAQATSPALAAKIANSYVRVFVLSQQSNNRRFFRSALRVVHQQLASLSPKQRLGSVGLQLQNRAQTLSLLSQLGYGNVEIASEAAPPTSPSSPKTKRDTALCAFLGLLIGVGLTLILERLERRIRTPEALESIYQAPLLGTIPETADLSRPRGKTASRPELPATGEAFSLVHAHMRMLSGGRSLRTLVVSSAEAGEGKTVIARHLAEAAAKHGSRVLLIEADLRQPTLAEQFGVALAPGLADVLIGETYVGNAIQRIDLNLASGERPGGGTLDVLAAGSLLPPNPGELLANSAAHLVLEGATWAPYDLVVIDTPALGVVSDAFALLPKVDGLVIVGRMGHSRRTSASRLHRVLLSSAAPLLGVVANGTARSRSPYGATTEGRGRAAEKSGASASSPTELTPTVET